MLGTLAIILMQKEIVYQDINHRSGSTTTVGTSGHTKLTKHHVLTPIYNVHLASSGAANPEKHTSYSNSQH
jgi:hypothetical protein